METWRKLRVNLSRIAGQVLLHSDSLPQEQRVALLKALIFHSRTGAINLMYSDVYFGGL